MNRRYAAIFALLALLCLWTAVTSSSRVSRALSGAAAVCCAGMAVAYARGAHGMLGKRSCGRMARAGLVLFGPYHALNWVLLRGIRGVSQRGAFDEIGPGVFLGGRLLAGDEERCREVGIRSVLDVTAEFPEVRFCRELSYRCIPLLDTCAPTERQLDEGVEWIRERLKEGGVYVHCAKGHGRSATFVAAYLMASGQAGEVEEALAQVGEKRPGVGLQRCQRQVLNSWHRSRSVRGGEPPALGQGSGGCRGTSP